MKDSIRQRLEDSAARFEEVSGLLADPEVIGDQDRYRELSREYARLEPVIEAWRSWQRALDELEAARQVADDPDASVRQMAREEEETAQAEVERHEAELQRLMLPRDPHDESNIFLEIRAAAGGDEAALFAGDLLRMYTRYAERQDWTVELVHTSEGEQGGYKAVVARLIGRGAYSQLKFESGAHRVQRVPETESQGRVHTSTCTVAVLPEAGELDAVELDPNDLRVDTYRASGAGGQHVNKTDSAVRLTHLPSGIVVECQDERSQHKNRARAMSLLAAKLLDAEREKRAREEALTRKSLVGTGDRSERIRTYNFPQGRVTDHRINLTLYQLDDVLEGGLDAVVQPLVEEHQAELLASLSTD